MESVKHYHLAFFVFSILTFASNQFVSAQNLIPNRVGDLWGFVDSTGSVIIDAQYLEVHSFYDQITSVKVGLAEWIFIDKAGRKVNDNTYMGVYEFQGGLAVVRPNIKNDFTERWAFMDNTGKHVTENYEYLGAFSEGLAVVKQNDKFGYMDTSLQIVIPLTYGGACDFREGVAAVNVGGEGYYPWTITGGKWGFINTSGELVIPIQYDSFAYFQNGEATVQIKKKRFKINKAGETIK